MTALLYRWPSSARFGRVVPKGKFYEHANVPRPVKERFVSDVQQIRWAYKLAETTINLRSSSEVPEVQVFEIGAKQDDVAESVLTAIDKAVRSPIIFEIGRESGGVGTTRMVAAHKRLGTGTPTLGPYFSAEWQSASERRVPLPMAIDLTSMYTALLEPLIPLASRVGEGLSDIVGRLTAVRALEREIAVLERKLRSETQLNRKVELRRTLKTKQAMLVDLTGPTPGPTTGDAT